MTDEVCARPYSDDFSRAGGSLGTEWIDVGTTEGFSIGGTPLTAARVRISRLPDADSLTLGELRERFKVLEELVLELAKHNGFEVEDA